MDRLLQKLMLGGSTAALVAVASFGAARAQGTGNDNIEQVVVSASRITIAGYTAPTPVTVVGAAQLESEANINLGDTIRQLPSLGTSEGLDNGSKAGDAAQGDAGVDSVALRNLGTTRTLVLFDGQRVVTSNPLGGGVDLSTIPTALIQRVDVVTGGASASWGSDAVGGVVNLILNKNFDGFKGNYEVGQNKTNNHQQYRTDMSFGTDIFGGRGHVIISGSYVMSPDMMTNTTNNWERLQTLYPSATLYPGVPNLPTYVHTYGLTLGSAQYTTGGLITASPAGTGVGAAAANALKGIQFTGQTASPTPFNFGTVFSGNCVNCSANLLTNTTQIGTIATPYHSTTLFGFARYKLTDTIQASVQLNYGTTYEENDDSDRTSNNVIIGGTSANANPFIPATVQARMVAGGITSITVSTNNLGNTNVRNPSTLDFAANSIGMGINYANRQLMRGVFTLDGALGEDWSWNAYVQHSQVREVQKDPMDALSSNYQNAVNAVTVSAANVGTSGLPIGSIQCQSTLAAPTNGCVPLNIFGTGNATEAALQYIQPGRNNPGLANDVFYKMYQDVVAGSVQGTLPWELPAGKVAVEFGAEYRHEQQRNQAAFPAIDGPALWSNGNFSSFAGQYEVEEGNVEIDGPILKDSIVQSLDFQLAGRITGYSTSGVVETWKIGLNSQINDDWKLRATWSEDIRAPIISELFAVPQYNRGTLVDPKTGKTANIFYTAQGNSALVPEEANTISAGIVMTPHWIDGLSASIDYYSIIIKGAITTPSNQQVENQCVGGNTLFCSYMFYAQPGFPIDYAGALNLVLNVPVNAGSQTTSGFDVQSNYQFPLFTGTMGLSLLANYTDQFGQTLFGQTFDGAGILGSDAGYTGTPKFKGSFQVTYAEGPWEGNIKVRGIGSARLVNTAQQSFVQSAPGSTVDNNNVPWVGYLDLGVQYKWNDAIEFFGTVKNTTNTPPPNIANSTGGGGTNLTIYDGIGRFYQGGIRVNLP
jgi:iron complex outermembrane recepter protein